MKWHAASLATPLGTLVALLAACDHPRRPPADPPTSAPNTDTAPSLSRFDDDEGEIVATLARLDPRIARRFGFDTKHARPPGVHPGQYDDDGGLAYAPVFPIDESDDDLLAFAERHAAIEKAEGIARSSLSFDVGKGDPRVDAERKLVGRFLREERARLEDEEDVAQSASALLEGLMDGFGAPGDAATVALRVKHVGATVEKIAGALVDGSLTRAEASELDDAILPLERMATAGVYLSTDGRPTLAGVDGALTGSLARLRGRLDAMKPKPDDPADRLKDLKTEASAYLGVVVDAETDARLAAVEVTLRSIVAAKIAAGIAKGATPAAVKGASAGLLVRGSCDGVSLMTRADPPLERAAICPPLRALAVGAPDDVAPFVVLHDDVVVGLWALRIAEGKDPEAATRTPRPIGDLSFDRETPLVRRIAVRPLEVFGAAEAIALVVAPPDGKAADETTMRDRANAWVAFGDGPIDVVARELHLAR